MVILWLFYICFVTLTTFLPFKYFCSEKKNFVEQGCQTDLNIAYVEQKVQKLEEENQELSTKCTELEDCVELLRNEYEKCEDYWQVNNFSNIFKQ